MALLHPSFLRSTPPPELEPDVFEGAAATAQRRWFTDKVPDTTADVAEQEHTELPDVVRTRPLSRLEHLDGGITVARTRYELSNGFDYGISAFVPADDKLKSPIPLLFTTPYGTGRPGHNELNARKFAQLGYATFLQGPEGEERTANPKRMAQSLGRLSMPQTARNTLAIYRDYGENCDVFNSPEFDQAGESRGAVVALAVSALAPEYGYRVRYNDVTAPPFPAPVTTFKQLLSAGKTSARELLWETPRAVAGIMREHHGPELIEYGKSVILHPGYAPYAGATAIALMRGHGGLYGQQLPPYSFARIREHKEDGWRQVGSYTYTDALGHLPNVYFETVPGGHMHLCNPESGTLAGVLRRLGHLAEERAVTPVDMVDYHAVARS